MEVPLFNDQEFYDLNLSLGRELYLLLKRELVDQFQIRTRRQLLLNNLFELFKKLEENGGADVFTEIWIDGSFVTTKAEPNDVDIVILHKTGTHVSRELQNCRLWREKYYCDIRYIEWGDSKTKDWFKNFFRNDSKGIIRINLEGDRDEPY